MERTAMLPPDAIPIYPARPQNACGRAFATDGRDDMRENTTDATTIQAVAYMRVNEHAAGRTADAQLQRQRNRCREVAQKHGLTIALEYIDMTGAVRLDRRPELNRLLAELPAIGATYVVIPDFGRLSREARDVIAIEQRLIGAGAELLVWGESEIHAHLRRRMTALIIEHGVGRESEGLEGDQE
jgi:hypothetical protein